jgi:hypothetical protein
MSRRHHTVAADMELVLSVVVMVVLMVVHQDCMTRLPTTRQQPMVLDLVVVMYHQVVMEVKDMRVHHHYTVQALLFKHIQLMLKVSIKIQTHKSSVVRLQVVYKPTHKTSEFASFNHHLSHPQAHSLLEKFAHLNHQHHPHFASVNKLLLSLNLLHSFFVNVHHEYQRQSLLKQLSAA